MKPKQFPLFKKCICLTKLSFNSVRNFSQMYLSTLAGFQYEAVSLDVNEAHKCWVLELRRS